MPGVELEPDLMIKAGRVRHEFAVGIRVARADEGDVERARVTIERAQHALAGERHQTRDDPGIIAGQPARASLLQSGGTTGAPVFGTRVKTLLSRKPAKVSNRSLNQLV